MTCITANKVRQRRPGFLMGRASDRSVPLSPLPMLNAGEIEILRQAAATADEIALLRAELWASSLVVAGYSGQPRPNPLLKIIQDHRLLLRRLVDSLALPDEGEESGLGPGQRHARTAANARWRERAEGNGKL